jgi:hypothetical protein
MGPQQVYSGAGGIGGGSYNQGSGVGASGPMGVGGALKYGSGGGSGISGGIGGSAGG